jgi:rhodanese-related sulfurtransferase
MRARFLLLLIFIGSAICLAAVKPLEQATLQKYLENGAPFDFILIDIRSAEETSSGGIGNANCKPYNLAWPDQFKAESAKIPKDKNIILYCRSGSRATRAAEYLDSLGYANVYNAGGALTWTGPTVAPSSFKSVSLLPAPSMSAKK